MFYCHFSRVATARAFLLVRGETWGFAGTPCPVPCGAEPPVSFLSSYFNLKMSSSSKKKPIATSTQISLAAARLSVASSAAASSSSSEAFKRSLGAVVSCHCPGWKDADWLLAVKCQLKKKKTQQLWIRRNESQLLGGVVRHNVAQVWTRRLSQTGTLTVSLRSIFTEGSMITVVHSRRFHANMSPSS